MLCSPGKVMEEARVTLIGVGNILMMDEGIGVHTVKAIEALCHVPTGLEVVDGGTAGLDLLPYIDGRERVLIVDAVDFGQEPGFIGMLENEDIPRVLEGQAKMSLHHLGLVDVIGAARLLDAFPQEICLIGIQPHTIDVGLEMTPLIKGRMKVLMEAVIDKLRDWDILCVLRQQK